MFDVTNGLPDTAAKEIWETATGKVFPNGWRTSQRTSRLQKYFAPAEISHDSDPERLVKVASPRKTQIVRSARMTRILWKRRIGNSVRRKFGDLITADRTIFNEGSETKARSSKLDRGTIFSYSMDSVVPVQNENFSGDGKRIYGNFSSRLKSRKSFTLTIKWNLDQTH